LRARRPDGKIVQKMRDAEAHKIQMPPKGGILLSR
jgi:hypothetical protein